MKVTEYLVQDQKSANIIDGIIGQMQEIAKSKESKNTAPIPFMYVEASSGMGKTQLAMTLTERVPTVHTYHEQIFLLSLQFGNSCWNARNLQKFLRKVIGSIPCT
jgi:hypothetical protein